MKAWFIHLAVIAATVGCSSQYRKSDPQVSDDQLMQWLSDAVTNVAQAQSTGGGGTSDAQTLASDPNTTIYFADTGGPMGNINTILDFDDLSFLGAGLTGITQARVFFLDNPSGGNGAHQDILLVGLQSGASADLQYYEFTGTGSVDSGVFQFSFAGNDGRQYTAVSYDVAGDNLNGDISLHIYDSDDNYVGKFSILAGFQ